MEKKNYFEDISSKVSSICQSVQAGVFTPEEQSWIDKIESLRSRINSSRTIIPPNRKVFLISMVNFAFQVKALFNRSASQISVGKKAQISSLPSKYGQILFHLVRYLKPERCLELGTCLGISGAYLAAALESNRKGRLITLEGYSFLSHRARRNFQKLGLKRAVVETGEFQRILPNVLLKYTPFDFIFIDGHHDRTATINYFSQIVPFLADPAMVVFDDIRWSEGMLMAWQEIKRHKNVFIDIDLSQMGICILSGEKKDQINSSGSAGTGLNH